MISRAQARILKALRAAEARGEAMTGRNLARAAGYKDYTNAFAMSLARLIRAGLAGEGRATRGSRRPVLFLTAAGRAAAVPAVPEKLPKKGAGYWPRAILEALEAADGAGETVSSADLARLLGGSNSLISQAVRRLVEDGAVKKVGQVRTRGSPSPVLILTPEGAARLRDLRARQRPAPGPETETENPAPTEDAAPVRPRRAPGHLLTEDAVAALYAGRRYDSVRLRPGGRGPVHFPRAAALQPSGCSLDGSFSVGGRG